MVEENLPLWLLTFEYLFFHPSIIIYSCTEFYYHLCDLYAIIVCHIQGKFGIHICHFISLSQCALIQIILRSLPRFINLIIRFKVFITIRGGFLSVFVNLFSLLDNRRICAEMTRISAGIERTSCKRYFKFTFPYMCILYS